MSIGLLCTLTSRKINNFRCPCRKRTVHFHRSSLKFPLKKDLKVISFFSHLDFFCSGMKEKSIQVWFYYNFFNFFGKSNKVSDCELFEIWLLLCKWEFRLVSTFFWFYVVNFFVFHLILPRIIYFKDRSRETFGECLVSV